MATHTNILAWRIPWTEELNGLLSVYGVTKEPGMIWLLNNNSLFNAQFIYLLKLSCVCVLIAQSCPALCDPMDYSPSGSLSMGILQARILVWVAIPFSRGSFQSRD